MLLKNCCNNQTIKILTQGSLTENHTEHDSEKHCSLNQLLGTNCALLEASRMATQSIVKQKFLRVVENIKFSKCSVVRLV